VRRVWFLAWLPVLACSNGSVESGIRHFPPGSATVSEAAGVPGDELIPAEWTVSEDTSESGEVITASVQLPAAKEIEGLLVDETSRLVLRCVNGKVEASIDTDVADAAEPGPDSSSTHGRTVRIQLDSAPPCE
jgi:hypothetical protein